MSDVIVLAMHGTPPNDFPHAELGEFFRLHSTMEGHGSSRGQEASKARYAELETKLRNWPRSAKNDPFYAGAMDLGKRIEKESGNRVTVGFNEFCAPDLPAAFEQAAALKPARIFVVTPMMTAGGDHSERDIPMAIAAARSAHPNIEFVYAWPFNQDEVASFLVKQINNSVK